MASDRLRIGFWMDPLEGIAIHHDTTFALMLECQRRGHQTRCFSPADLYFDGRPRARMRSVFVRRERGRHFDVLSESDQPLSELDVLFLRKDPPVDAEYWHATQLFELAQSAGGPFCINAPSGLRDANEKLFALRFVDLVPRTLVSSDLERLRTFVEEVGQVVLKPIDGFAGRGVLQMKPGDRNLNSVLELMTARGTLGLIAQAYIPESRAGDKRILLLNGEPLGAVLRVPAGTDPRGNLAAGAQPVKGSLTARDRQICARLAPELLTRGLYLVGIDVIGDYLTEVNVTSPTGLVEIDALDGSSLESRVIDFAEQPQTSKADQG